MDSQRLLESLNAGRVAKSMGTADADCDSVWMWKALMHIAYTLTRRACRLKRSGSGLDRFDRLSTLAYQP